MKSLVEIDGRTLSSIKEASKVVSYSNDYITRLAREGKIFATMIGRQWYIDLNSLQSYEEDINLEQEIRKRHLSEERKGECQIRDKVKKQKEIHMKRSHTLHKKALTIALLVLAVGISGGYSTYNLISIKSNQVAAIQEVQKNINQTNDPEPLNEVPNNSAFNFDIDSDINVAKTDLQKMVNAQEGILLLPNSSTSSVVDDFFSDRVTVIAEPEGYFISRIDKNGDLIGEKIPYVVVPVINN